jgi:pimeloyl-ACP methyl ester carboxylesterase
VCGAADRGGVDGATLALGDGRKLGYAQCGRPDGEPFFYFHGHPGSRLEARFADRAAAEAGLRVIALDRPGYGLSDFQPGRLNTDWPAAVARATDLLRIGRFSVTGASGGGPYALACGWRLPDRVTRAAVISGVGPYQVPGITRGMRRWTGTWPGRSRAAHATVLPGEGHLLIIDRDARPGRRAVSRVS